MNLQQLIEKLECSELPIVGDELGKVLSMTDFDEQCLRPFLNFDSKTYQRNLIARREQFEMLLLCFEAGQRTPIHDHTGSACAVKIIEGVGVETDFEMTPEGWVFAKSSRSLKQGDVLTSFGPDIHQLSNLQSKGQRLVTMHIYSPPLNRVGNYSIEDGRFIQVKAAENQSEFANF